MKRILVVGAGGQIGSELTTELRKRYGSENVVASDKRRPGEEIFESGPFELLDCTDRDAVNRVVQRYKVDTIYHLAALLSAVGEKNPLLAWNVNMGCLLNVLEVAKENNCAVFFPSSIGAFGPNTPKDNTPQDTIQRPNTIYGITKVAGELLCDYYHQKFGVDTRGVRFPGLISYVALPGGGTTDYAVEIYYEALKHGKYTCYLRPDTRMDMMYMPDAIKAAIDIMEADERKLIHRNAFNITAMSFSPAEIAQEIKKHIPDFAIEYDIDPVRQAIADSWPNRIDDSAARAEWGWKPEYDLESMTTDMLEKLSSKLSIKL
ncbi:L-threonine 3-dehydrogenase [Mesoaciditoga sp.]